MEHFNPLLTNLKSDHKFITIGEIMLRLTPPNYQKIRMANEFEATYGGSEANIAQGIGSPIDPSCEIHTHFPSPICKPNQ